jgi:hypothetical protein
LKFLIWNFEFNRQDFHQPPMNCEKRVTYYERNKILKGMDRQLIPGYITDHPEFREVWESMMSLWEDGAGAF